MENQIEASKEESHYVGHHASTVEISTKEQLDYSTDSVINGDIEAQILYGSACLSDYHCAVIKTPERFAHLANLAGADVTDGNGTREFEYRGVTFYERIGDSV